MGRASKAVSAIITRDMSWSVRWAAAIPPAEGPAAPVSRPGTVPTPIRLVSCWQATRFMVVARLKARVLDGLGMDAMVLVLS